MVKPVRAEGRQGGAMVKPENGKICKFANRIEGYQTSDLKPSDNTTSPTGLLLLWIREAGGFYIG